MNDMPLQSESTNNSRINTQKWLIVSQSSAVLIIFVGSVFSLLGGPICVFSVCALIITLLVSAIFAWRLYADHQYRRATIISSIPLLTILLILALDGILLWFLPLG